MNYATASRRVEPSYIQCEQSLHVQAFMERFIVIRLIDLDPLRGLEQLRCSAKFTQIIALSVYRPVKLLSERWFCATSLRSDNPNILRLGRPHRLVDF